MTACGPTISRWSTFRSARITGFERWCTGHRTRHDPRGGVHSGGRETGLINPLDRLMLRRACMDAAQWPDDVRVAVNLSPLQFRVGNLLSLVMRMR